MKEKLKQKWNAIESNLQIKSSYIILYLSFVLFSSQLIGQIDLETYQADFGEGLTTLKKKVNISFVYDDKSQSYMAKVKHQIQRLYIGNDDETGLVQVPFNEFQDLKLLNARYFKIDSLGEKRLVENVKVKYSDEKNYFIQNIFYSDLKVKQFQCSVGLPENYIVSYSYEVLYKDLKFLTSFFLQWDDEAVEDVEISIKKDPNVKFSIYEFYLDAIQKTESETYVKFKGNNLSRFKSNAASVNGSYYLPHIIVSVGEVTTKDKTSEVLKSTDNLYDWYKTLIKELKPDEAYINNLASTITEGSTNDAEKIDDIFKWVQDNIQYVAFENGIAGFKPDEAHNVASSKFGDCKGIANLLVNLLQAEGFDAQHAWIGTRSKNYDYSIPSLVVDNHMICGLKFNDNMYFLDGTSKSASWQNPPSHLESKQVLVGKGEAYEVLTVKESTPDENTINIKGVLDLSKAEPTIDLNVEFSGHFKTDFIGSNKHMPINRQQYLSYYFVDDYLDGVIIKQISDVTTTKTSVSYDVSGSYTNLAKQGRSLTVFPFLDVLAYENLLENMPSVYVDYPQTITVKLQVINNNKLPNKVYAKEQMGNEKFSADFFTESVGGNYFVHQKLKLNLFHSSLDSHTEWNDFVSNVKAFNNYPLIYE